MRYLTLNKTKVHNERVGIMVCVQESFDTYLLPPSQLHHTPPSCFCHPGLDIAVRNKGLFLPRPPSSASLANAGARARSLASAVKWRWVGWFGNEKGLARMRRDKRRKEGTGGEGGERESKRMERTINTTQFGRRAACSREGKKDGTNWDATRPRQGLPTTTILRTAGTACNCLLIACLLSRPTDRPNSRSTEGHSLIGMAAIGR